VFPNKRDFGLSVYYKINALAIFEKKGIDREADGQTDTPGQQSDPIRVPCFN